MVSLAKLLNSDIDYLEAGLLERNEGMVQERVFVLQKKWPTKKDQIQVKIAKLITELGLKEI